MAGTYRSAALVRGRDGHDLAVGQISGAASWGFVPRPETEAPVLDVIDLTKVQPLGQVRPNLYALHIEPTIGGAGYGAELPAGWILTSGITHRDDESVSFFAVDLSDGRVVPLPPLGGYDRP